jgi:hypothetical protein
MDYGQKRTWKYWPRDAVAIYKSQKIQPQWKLKAWVHREGLVWLKTWKYTEFFIAGYEMKWQYSITTANNRDMVTQSRSLIAVRCWSISSVVRALKARSSFLTTPTCQHKFISSSCKEIIETEMLSVYLRTCMIPRSQWPWNLPAELIAMQKLQSEKARYKLERSQDLNLYIYHEGSEESWTAGG